MSYVNGICASVFAVIKGWLIYTRLLCGALGKTQCDPLFWRIDPCLHYCSVLVNVDQIVVKFVFVSGHFKIRFAYSEGLCTLDSKCNHVAFKCI